MSHQGRPSKKEIEDRKERDKYKMIPTDYLTGNVDIAKSPLDYLMDKELSAVVEQTLDTLEPRTKSIFLRYYGFTDEPDVTLRSLAKDLNISVERVRQIQCKSLRKLKHPKHTIKFKDVSNSELVAYCSRSLPARHYIPFWKRPILAHVEKYRYAAYHDFDLRSFLQGKMTTEQMLKYFHSKEGQP